MKKYYLAIAIILIIALYLYLAHAFIYYRMRLSGLTAPQTQASYLLNSQTASAKNLIYAALGDSLTAGMGLDKYEKSFPYLLAHDLAGGDNITLRNFSFPGYRTDDLIKNLLEPAIAAKPDIITLLIGTNDVQGFYSQKKFKTNYQYILERLTKETKAKIYAISLPFIGTNNLILPPYNYYFNYQTANFNNIIQNLAAAYGVKYVDIATPTKILFQAGGQYYAADSFHPSPQGYELWEKIIYENIKK